MFCLSVTIVDDPDGVSVTASITSTVTDSTSMASVDSAHIPYHILDRSGESSSMGGSIGPGFDKSSLSNKSDQEVLLESKLHLYRALRNAF